MSLVAFAVEQQEEPDRVLVWELELELELESVRQRRVVPVAAAPEQGGAAAVPRRRSPCHSPGRRWRIHFATMRPQTSGYAYTAGTVLLPANY